MLIGAEQLDGIGESAEDERAQTAQPRGFPLLPLQCLEPLILRAVFEHECADLQKEIGRASCRGRV